MSLKARLRIAIVALVTLVVVAMSLLYLYDFTVGSFHDASSKAGLIADQVRGFLADRLSDASLRQGVRADQNLDSWRALISTDPEIRHMLQWARADSELVQAIVVTDQDGKILASSNRLIDTPLRFSDDFGRIDRGFWLSNLWDLLARREDYVTTRPLGAQPGGAARFQVAVIVRSGLLKRAIQPALINLAAAFAAALIIAAFLGSVLPNLVLDPLERLSRSIDLIRAGKFDPRAIARRRQTREFADVQSKLNLLGEQYQGARQDAVDLRSNVEQLVRRLEEGVLLFDNKSRLIAAGESAERMLGIPHDRMIGHPLDAIFPADTAIGEVIAKAVQQNKSVHDQPVTIARANSSPVKLLVSVQAFQKTDSAEELGTLITFRDAESRRQLQHQLDVSSRLAAISRLTGGVAHEIKNPLNAIALHLEVLKGKVEGQQPEIEVISSEIKRLDSVVKTFLNFNKPVNLQNRPVDLSQLLEQVFALVARAAEAKRISLQAALQPGLFINGDPDLLKQAILNIVNNGLEAMEEGGALTARTLRDGDECQLSITDSGPGIPLEIRDRIFNLYFTTKEHGSGIGLATTFRLVQLHSGTIDFVSELGKGTTFRLGFPRLAEHQAEVFSSATAS